MIVDMRTDYSPATITIHNTRTNQVLAEVSLIALDKSSGSLLAIGNEAKQLIHDNNSNIIIFSPLRNGAIADYPLAEKMLKYLLFKVSAVSKVIFFKTTILAVVPDDYTMVERKALEDALYMAGARMVMITEKAKADTGLTNLSAYRVIIEITSNDIDEQGSKERWQEICKDEIPPDAYQITSFCRPESEMIITLTGRTNVAEIIFDRVSVLKKMVKETIPDHYFTESELVKYRDQSFKNVIYQIEGGQLCKNLSSRGKAFYLDVKHYILVGESEVVEVLAEFKGIVVKNKDS